MLDSPMPGPRSRLAARASAAPVVPAGLRAMDLVAASAVLHRPQPPRARLDRLRLHVAVPDGPDLGARGPAGGRGCRTRKSSCKPQGAIDLTTRLQAGMVELGSVRSCFTAGIDDAAPVHRRRGCGGRGQAAIRPPAGRPRSVRAWLDAAGPSQLHIASITVSELYLGLALARPFDRLAAREEDQGWQRPVRRRNGHAAPSGRRDGRPLGLRRHRPALRRAARIEPVHRHGYSMTPCPS